MNSEVNNSAAQPLDLDKLVDAYSEAWGKSWESLNPLDECEADGECRLHMRAGIEAVVALIAQARAAKVDTTASGSIDTPEFRALLSRVQGWKDGYPAMDGSAKALIAHIDTWAASRERELCAKMGARQVQIDQLTAERSAGDAVLAPLYSTRQDAERFRRAIALEDNAEALYAAVLSHAPDGNAIRRAFDSDAAPAPGNTAQPEKDG